MVRVIAGALWLLAHAPLVHADEPRAARAVAVLPVQSDERSGLGDALEPIRDAVALAFVNNPGWTVTKREDLDRALAEQGWQAEHADYLDEARRAASGQLAGAAMLATAKVSKVEQTYYLYLALVDVQTGATTSALRQPCDCGKTEVIERAARMAEQLAGPVQWSGGQVVAASLIQAPAGQGEHRTVLLRRPDGAARPERAGRCPDGMVFVDGVTLLDEASTAPQVIAPFCIDAFEYPNKDGVTPLAGLDLERADARCRTGGKRLCLAGEWDLACRGDELHAFPYGERYQEKSCWAGKRFSSGVGASGAHLGCRGTRRIFDMSGNLWEWVVDAGADRLGLARGGDWSAAGAGAACAASKRVVKTSREESIGFRCCQAAGP